MKPDAHQTPIRRFVTGLPVQGRYHFTTGEVIEATGASRAALGADALIGPLAARIGRVAKEYVPLDAGGWEPVRSRSQRRTVNVNHEVELES